MQETQYDPAGLELAGLAPPSPGIRGLNNYRFNGKEFQADLGLGWNHQDWRFFDPQLLRWHAVDPEIENGQESWTPYSFGYDNAVRYNDADGRCPCRYGVDGDIVNRAVLGVGISLFNLAAKAYASVTGANEKWVAGYATDGEGTAVDYAYHKESIGTAGQEAKAVALDALNVGATFVAPGEGKLFEQVGGKVIVSEAVQEVKAVVTPRLLQGEGKVGTYRNLKAAGSKGDNITPHHMPSTNHMETHGVAKNDGIAMNMEHPHPGTGGRHRSTATYGNTSDVNMTSRDALAAGVKDARQIYQNQGLYSPAVRQSLQEVIWENKSAFPLLFSK